MLPPVLLIVTVMFEVPNKLADGVTVRVRVELELGPVTLMLAGMFGKASYFGLRPKKASRCFPSKI
jgi:hypothetical protein